MDKEIQLTAIKERVIAQLDGFYTDDNWVSENLKTKVFSLDAEKAIVKPNGHSHSVAQLLSHMIAWRNFVLQKLQGNDAFDIEDNSESDWPTTTGWNELKDDFEKCHRQLTDAIQNFPVGRLESQVAGRRYSFLFLITGILEHDYYHYGQIGSAMASLDRQEKV